LSFYPFADKRKEVRDSSFLLSFYLLDIKKKKVNQRHQKGKSKKIPHIMPYSSKKDCIFVPIIRNLCPLYEKGT